MALLPARRTGTLSRPGSQAPARWDPFAESGELYQRMGQLLGGAFDGGWQPPVQGWGPLADLSETGDAYLAEAGLPGVARDDISAGLAG
jgi:HSP20 family protein